MASKTNTSVDLKWKSPEKHNGPILEYRVHWKNRTHEDEKGVHSSQLSYTVRTLIPYVEYTFKVLAVTEAGRGPWSKEQTVRTDVGSKFYKFHLSFYKSQFMQ